MARKILTIEPPDVQEKKYGPAVSEREMTQRTRKLGFSDPPLRLGNTNLWYIMPAEIPVHQQEFILAKHNNTNRPKGPSKIKELTADFVDGLFLFNLDAVLFDQNDELLNGQTRLEAASGAGGIMRAFVIFNAHPDLVKGHDRARKRTVSHNLPEFSEEQGGFVAGSFTGCRTAERPSPARKEQMLLTCSKTARWVSKQFPEKIPRVTVTGVLAAIHGIRFHLALTDLPRLQEFCQVLREGQTRKSAANGAALLLLEFLATDGKWGINRTPANIYALTTAAWDAFKAEETPSRLALPESCEYLIEFEAEEGDED